MEQNNNNVSPLGMVFGLIALVVSIVGGITFGIIGAGIALVCGVIAIVLTALRVQVVWLWVSLVSYSELSSLSDVLYVAHLLQVRQVLQVVCATDV